jgi:hypothetical protein
MRLGVEDRLHAAWTDFDAREWMGATIFAAAALEALLLWALKRARLAEMPKRPLDELYLPELIRVAAQNRVINDAAEKQASLAKDARNLIHPGKVSRTGEACSKTTALTALTAVYRVIDELKSMS